MQLMIIGILVLVLIAAGGIKLWQSRASTAGAESRGRLEARPPLTRNEQSMYSRLAAAFAAPDFMVFPQVGFGALLVAKGGASRRNFERKRADFVLLDRSFLVLAIVGLDDGASDNKEQGHASGDAMLRSAGYKVMRYRKVPDVERLRADVNKQILAARRA